MKFKIEKVCTSHICNFSSHNNIRLIGQVSGKQYLRSFQIKFSKNWKSLMKKKNKFKKNIHERIFARSLHIYLIMKIAWKHFLSKLFMKNTSYFVITVIW
jgi:hypothetical protein